MRIRGSTLRLATVVAAASAALGLVGPSSSAAPGCGWGSFNDQRPPGSCWRPFSETSPFNRPLPLAPAQTRDSPVVGTTVAGWGGAVWSAGTADSEEDFNHPIYFSGPGNPVFRIHCLEFGGDCPVEGHRVAIPNLARPAGGDDGSLAVIDQRKGWEYDFWQVTSKPRGGGRIDASWAGRTRIGKEDATGLRAGGTAAGFALSAGIIRPAELRAGVIDHALFMVVKCTNGTHVWPAAGTGSGRRCSEIGLPNARGPALGAHFYLEMTGNEIDALALPEWQKTILRAMATYGMFVGDTGGDGWGIKVESGSSLTSFGRPDPWVKLARRIDVPAYLSRAGSTRYVFDMRASVDWASQLRVAAPCVSRGRC